MEFPLGKAQVQRQLLLARAIIHEGFDVTVLCRYGIHNESDGIDKEGIFEEVNYIYCSGTSVRPEGILKRNFLKIKGLFNEIYYYWQFSKRKQLAGVLVSTNNFYNIPFYFLLGKLFKSITVIDNVEYWTAITDHKGFDRFDKYLYDKLYFYFSDRIICISDFLKLKVPAAIRDKVIKIPAITDFEKFSIKIENPKLVEGEYFLYCGSENYFEVIDFVISAFEAQAEYTDTSLALVTKHTGELQNRIERSNTRDRIFIFSGIPYSELVNLYRNSQALIIPMRNSDQDKARFPHKISEYCASKRPIITNSVGEINNYFTKANSFLCDAYDIQDYSKAMMLATTDQNLSETIATESYYTGIRNFNYLSYSRSLIDLYQRK
ncbi:MAG TPA: hypothetical protein DEO60_03135 [Bacteroidales bacterium]|jgi:hypothetical protein|nr:hypothetical protein [Bacteroidales bacterium]HBZ20099.1 hypothetical protein [Bacteroidales bacterium]